MGWEFFKRTWVLVSAIPVSKGTEKIAALEIFSGVEKSFITAAELSRRPQSITSSFPSFTLDAKVQVDVTSEWKFKFSVSAVKVQTEAAWEWKFALIFDAGAELAFIPGSFLGSRTAGAITWSDVYIFFNYFQNINR